MFPYLKKKKKKKKRFESFVCFITIFSIFIPNTRSYKNYLWPLLIGVKFILTIAYRTSFVRSGGGGGLSSSPSLHGFYSTYLLNSAGKGNSSNKFLVNANGVTLALYYLIYRVRQVEGKLYNVTSP